MVRYCLIVLILFFIIGCASNLPEKSSHIKTGVEVTAPKGYYEISK